AFWHKPDGIIMPRPYYATESIYVDRKTDRAMVLRSMWPNNNWPIKGRGHSITSTKPATVEELDRAMDLLEPYIESDRLDVGLGGTCQIPKFLEVGYGLDPSAIRGGRVYAAKIGLGIDRAVGHYENKLGQLYAKAVLSKTVEYQRFVASEREGKLIKFMIGD